MADKHDEGVTWHFCTHAKCNFKAKQLGNLKAHIAAIHNINTKWFACKHCNYTTKQNSHLKVHMANIHNVDVTWHYCKEADCDYKTKLNGLSLPSGCFAASIASCRHLDSRYVKTSALLASSCG